ncbi:hypothetical protein [Solimonas fluminis]|uniref:hypothetical protein n=1 Tax=Solimonas fluminis TaxID=2086571 RepID=UPI0010575042|nr:hypothetical protein [Solimonas fluminis]
MWLGIYFSWTALNTRTYSQSSISDVQREFSSIAAPSNSRRVSDIRKSSKVTVQAVYADFLVPPPIDSIALHYEEQLLATGWREVARGDRTRKFCKADMDAVIEIIETSSTGVRYYFGVTRESGPARKTGC